MKKTKLYCYVDETGQDGLQSFFLVSIVITDKAKKDNLEVKIEEIERETKKGIRKWTKTNNIIRTTFIKEITKLKEL